MNYSDRVGKMLLDLQVEEVYELNKKVKPENRDKFIAVVKSYIDKNFGSSDGWEIIFSNDYTKLKKQKL